jgi:hypothetical protein
VSAVQRRVELPVPVPAPRSMPAVINGPQSFLPELRGPFQPSACITQYEVFASASTASRTLGAKDLTSRWLGREPRRTGC